MKGDEVRLSRRGFIGTVSAAFAGAALGAAMLLEPRALAAEDVRPDPVARGELTTRVVQCVEHGGRRMEVTESLFDIWDLEPTAEGAKPCCISIDRSIVTNRREEEFDFRRLMRHKPGPGNAAIEITNCVFIHEPGATIDVAVTRAIESGVLQKTR